MHIRTLAIAAAALAAPMVLAAPSEAKTAYQLWAQGQGVYVSSKEHPPFELQQFITGDFDPYRPGLPYGAGYAAPPPGYGYGYGAPPPGYGYGYGDPDY